MNESLNPTNSLACHSNFYHVKIHIQIGSFYKIALIWKITSTSYRQNLIFVQQTYLISRSILSVTFKPWSNVEISRFREMVGTKNPSRCREVARAHINFSRFQRYSSRLDYLPLGLPVFVWDQLHFTISKRPLLLWVFTVADPGGESGSPDPPLDPRDFCFLHYP